VVDAVVWDLMNLEMRFFSSERSPKNSKNWNMLPILIANYY
jgi:hypothetical protein